MSNRFLYYFFSTTILVTIYFNFEPDISNLWGASEVVLQTFLVNYDFIFFSVYLFYKYKNKRNQKVLFLGIGYLTMILFSFFEVYNFHVLRNWELNIHMYFGFHSIARFLLLLAIFPIKTEQKSPQLYFLLIFILLSSSVFYYMHLELKNLETKYPYPFLSYIYSGLLAYCVYISTTFRDLPSKKSNILFFLSLILILISDFINIQNFIFNSEIFSFENMRIINTLGELGIVYFVLNRSQKSRLIKLN